MGKIQTKNTSSDSDSEVHTHDLGVRFVEEIKPCLKQLTHWPLTQVRSVYDHFRRRSSDPRVEKTIFCKLLPFTKSISDEIFLQYGRCNKHINIFEFLSALILTAHGSHLSKMKILFLLFDLDGSNSISLQEMIFVFKSIIIGYNRMGGEELPDYPTLEKWAKIVFSKADMHPDHTLAFEELMNFIEGNDLMHHFLMIWEPSRAPTETSSLFNPFKPYSTVEHDIIWEHSLYINKKEVFTKSDPEEIIEKLSDYEKVFYSNTNSSVLQSLMCSMTYLPKIHENNLSSKYGSTAIKESALPSIRRSSVGSFPNNYSSPSKRSTGRYKVHSPRLNKKMDGKIATNIIKNSIHSKQNIKRSPERETKILNDQQDKKLTYYQEKMPVIVNKRINFNLKEKNTLIASGKTFTKKEILDLANYFDKLADGSQKITISTFCQAFVEKEYMKKVAGSLYKFLDGSNHGVTFEQFLKKFYPNLDKKSLEKIMKWINISRGKANSNDSNFLLKHQEHKPTTPYHGLQSLKGIFENFDVGNKGFLTLQDYIRGFESLEVREIEKMFKRNDFDNTGKITFFKFVKSIVPYEYHLSDSDIENSIKEKLKIDPHTFKILPNLANVTQKQS